MLLLSCNGSTLKTMMIFVPLSFLISMLALISSLSPLDHRVKPGEKLGIHKVPKLAGGTV
jgi:hypothetical protein